MAVLMYKGKPLEDYSKEELVSIVNELYRFWQRDLASTAREREMLLDFAKVREDAHQSLER
jgi:hypothetical protein